MPSWRQGALCEYCPPMTDDEGVLDPWVEEWFAANPMIRHPFDDLSPELLALARAPLGAPSTREIASVRDEVIAGVPVRVYEHDQAPTGLVVYFHGGGFCIGSVGMMDNVARELAHCTGAAVISVEYRLAPEHPFPAGLDDCEAVTRWALAHAADLGASPDHVGVAGESAGGNLAADVALRRRRGGRRATSARRGGPAARRPGARVSRGRPRRRVPIARAVRRRRNQCQDGRGVPRRLHFGTPARS